MPTISHCKACQKEVSYDAPACPHCGQPWPARGTLTKPLPVMGCLLVVFLVLGIIVLGNFLGFC